jgi:tetratricopeptide (TPR) repeat protein
MGRFRDAMDSYIQATQLDELLADAWMGMGICSEAMGDLVGAERYMQKTVEIDNINPDYWYALGDVQIKADKPQKAVIAYQKVAELDPRNPEIWLDYSDIYATKGDFDQAVEIVRNGLSQLKNNPDLLYRLAAYEYLRGKAQASQEVLYKALSINYSRHRFFLKYHPDIQKNDIFIEMITTFKQH